MAGNFVRPLKGSDFEAEVLQSCTPAIVDFWGDHCGSCKGFVPVLESLAEENKGQISVFSVDVAESPDLAARFNVRALPTLLFFREGELKHTHIGLLSKGGMLAKLSA